MSADECEIDGLAALGREIGRRVAAGDVGDTEAHQRITVAVSRSRLPASAARTVLLDAFNVGMLRFHPAAGVPYEARCLAHVPVERMRWLWPTRLAEGKLNLIAGQPGMGKSQITALMAATVSNGAWWPDGSRAPRGSVVFVSCEDDAADTVVPRLHAVGANLHRVHILDWVREPLSDGSEALRSYRIGSDVDALGALCSDIGDVRLVVIDPVSTYMGAVDSHKMSDVRGTLAPLQALAAERGICVVMITHLNKGTEDGAAMSRVAGSVAYVAACRSAWFVSRHPQDETKRIFTPLKNNIGDDRTGFSYTIETVNLGNDVATSRVAFGEQVEISADAVLAARGPDTKGGGALADAVEFLRELLSGGPQTATASIDAAREAGIAKRTLDRAKIEMGVKSHKSSAGQWVWALPAEHRQDRQDCQEFPLGDGGKHA